MADLARSGLATSPPAPFLTRAVFAALRVPVHPNPAAPTPSQFILSRILPSLSSGQQFGPPA